MNNIVQFPVSPPPTTVGPMIGVIAGSSVIEGASGPLLEIRFVTALKSINQEQRRRLPRLLNSGNFTALTLEQAQ